MYKSHTTKILCDGNIFSAHSLQFPLPTHKMCIIVHVTSRKRQITVDFTGPSTAVDTKHGTSFMLSFWCLKFGDGSYFIENLWTPAVQFDTPHTSAHRYPSVSLHACTVHQ